MAKAKKTAADRLMGEEGGVAVAERNGDEGGDGQPPMPDGVEAGERMSAPKAKAAGGLSPKAAKISIPELRPAVMKIGVVSDSMLVIHQWSTKARETMYGKHTGIPQPPRGPKNPVEDFLETLYVFKGSKAEAVGEYVRGGEPVCAKGDFGIKASALKAAMVAACRYAGIAMTAAKGLFHIVPDGYSDVGDELVRIRHDEWPVMREDFVRNATGVADIRYRGSFPKWGLTVTIRYNSGFVTPSQLANLLHLAGFSVGLAEGRPGSKEATNGTWGMFRVARADEMPGFPAGHVLAGK